MKIYVLLMAWATVLFTLGTIVSFLIMCCCDPRAATKESYSEFVESQEDLKGYSTFNKGQGEADAEFANGPDREDDNRKRRN